MSPTMYQTEHGLLREVLRGFLVAQVQASHGTGGCGQVGCGTAAALDALLAAHPLDRRGRCRSCRGAGWLGRHPRVCRVFLEAHYWLRQRTHRVHVHVASELGVDVPSPSGAADPDATEVLPKVADDPTHRSPSKAHAREV